MSLLSAQQVGRIAVVVDGGPQVFPVNYALHQGSIVIRTDEGTKLDAAPLSKVALEVDEFDDETRLGWSVLVRGVGQDITNAVDPVSVELKERPIDHWAPGPKNHWIKIEPQIITGRRLVEKRVARVRSSAGRT